MKIFLKKGIKMLLLVFSLTILPCMSANAAAKTSVKALKVGSTFTIKNASKVTSSKKRVAKATKKSSNKYKIAAKKKGASTLRVYNKKGRLTKKIYLLAYNGKTFSYNTSTINLAKGAKKTVKASTNQSGVTIKYKSSDTSVAAVNSKGKITAKAAGQATIRALFYYKGKKVKTVNKKVNVCSGKAKTAAASGGSPNSATSSDSGSSSKSSGSSGSFKYHSDAQSSYTCTGGKFTKIDVYCEKASDQVTFELSNACVEITDITHSPGYDGWNNANCYFTGVTVYARVKGTCKMTIKVNGVSKETITFTVTSNDEQWAVYKNWKSDVIAEIWDNSMNDLEKITVLVDFINTNYKYSASCCSYYGFALGYSGDCIAAADLVIDFAKELGYSGELISTNYAVATHRAARIYIGSTYYDVDVWANVIYNSAGKAVYMNGEKTSYWPE